MKNIGSPAASQMNVMILPLPFSLNNEKTQKVQTDGEMFNWEKEQRQKNKDDERKTKNDELKTELDPGTR